MTNYWWVNQGQTYKSEINGGYMWSPKEKRNGARNQFYLNMTLVKINDIVFSYANKHLKAIGRVVAVANSSDKPEEFGKIGEVWQKEGWCVEVEYTEFDTPIKPSEHMNILRPLLPKTHSPLNGDGKGNQVYLCSIDTKMAEQLLQLIGSDAEKIIGDVNEEAIKNDKSILSTEKSRLISSRIGQGAYRQKLIRIEKHCRITKVDDPRFLIASHIKPWSKSSNFERIDGNNGLLLSPHIDKLFDQGYLSFENNGRVLISKELPVYVADVWGLVFGTKTKEFSLEQTYYLEYHRKNIFKN